MDASTFYSFKLAHDRSKVKASCVGRVDPGPALDYSTMNATDTTSDVLAALGRFNAVAKVGDAAALDALLHTDLMYSHSNARVEDKAGCIAGLVRSNIDFQLRDGLTVRVYNDGTCAMVHGMMDAHNPGGVIVPLHFMMMWVNNGQDWLLVGRHTAKLPA